MSETARSRAASLAHLRRDGLAKGDPIPLPLTMAAIFHNPGDGAGYSQYGRYSNATWDAVEQVEPADIHRRQVQAAQRIEFRIAALLHDRAEMRRNGDPPLRIDPVHRA